MSEEESKRLKDLLSHVLGNSRPHGDSAWDEIEAHRRCVAAPERAGGASGGSINVVTRIGANQFHGIPCFSWRR